VAYRLSMKMSRLIILGLVGFGYPQICLGGYSIKAAFLGKSYSSREQIIDYAERYRCLRYEKWLSVRINDSLIALCFYNPVTYRVYMLIVMEERESGICHVINFLPLGKFIRRDRTIQVGSMDGDGELVIAIEKASLGSSLNDIFISDISVKIIKAWIYKSNKNSFKKLKNGRIYRCNEGYYMVGKPSSSVRYLKGFPRLCDDNYVEPEIKRVEKK